MPYILAQFSAGSAMPSIPIISRSARSCGLQRIFTIPACLGDGRRIRSSSPRPPPGPFVRPDGPLLSHAHRRFGGSLASVSLWGRTPTIRASRLQDGRDRLLVEGLAVSATWRIGPLHTGDPGVWGNLAAASSPPVLAFLHPAFCSPTAPFSTQIARGKCPPPPPSPWSPDHRAA